MKSIKFSLIILLAYTLTSCENVIQVKLDKGTPEITIDAFINDMRVAQKVRLTYTDDYFSQTNNAPITGATVRLKNLTTNEVFNFTDNSNGDYVFNIATTDTLARIGSDYELTVNHQGNIYTSNTKLNRTTQIDSIKCEFKEAGLGGKEGYKVSFLAFDIPGGEPDFYWIKSYRNGKFFNKGIEINVAYDAAYSSGSDGLFFIQPIAEGVTPQGEVFKKYDDCRIEIHSISHTTYDFLIQVQKQTTNSGLFATTPENVKSNITSAAGNSTKVVGWFSMSAVGFKSKIVE